MVAVRSTRLSGKLLAQWASAELPDLESGVPRCIKARRVEGERQQATPGAATSFHPFTGAEHEIDRKPGVVLVLAVQVKFPAAPVTVSKLVGFR